MSNPVQTTTRTSIAVVSWVDGDATFARLYTQDTNGGIRESCYNGKSWSVGDVIASAKANSPITAYRSPDKNAPMIFVYYLTSDNLVNGVRRANSGDWNPDPINNLGALASPASRLAIANYADDTVTGAYFHLFYQKNDTTICRWVPGGGEGWIDNSSFSDKLLDGTGLAAVGFKSKDADGAYTKTIIFYQLADNTLTSCTSDRNFDQFNPGDPELISKTKGQVPPLTNLSAISTRDGEHPQFQLYSAYQGSSYTKVAEWGYYSGSWKHANPASIPVAADSGIAMFQDTTSQLYKIYVQHATDQIFEYTAVNPWGPWKFSTLVPTEQPI